MKIGTLQFNTPVFLAPMAGVTDLSFRAICKSFGCDLTYTEMVSAKGLHYKNERTRELLQVSPVEIPFAVQIFGSEPDIMADIAQKIEQQYGQDLALIDINMGCPMAKITGNHEGSALMRTPGLAAKIIEKVSKAVSIPVTVKFRKGWDDQSINAVEFAVMAQQNGAAAVTVHGRTRMQFYTGKADWGIIRAVKAAVSIPVIGNGDIFCAQDAVSMIEQTGCDGIMVARGAQGNPWIFEQVRTVLSGRKPPAPVGFEERINMAAQHARTLVEYRGPHAIVQMRKHVAWYIKGLPGAAEVRDRVNHIENLFELEKMLSDYRKKLRQSGLELEQLDNT